jgi:protein-S-isoprenylcysteine O-methyltransferase Ste14
MVDERSAASPPRHTFVSILCNIGLAAFYSLFVIAHLLDQREWDWAYQGPVILQQSIMVLAFLTRRPSFETSRQPLDWAAGIAGTLMPMLLRPTPVPGSLTWLGRPLMITGFVVSIGALLSLGRSIAVVPANRGLQTGGAYSLVRHPVYAAYSVTFVGYLIGSPSSWNVVIVGAAVFLLGLRAVLEERFLKREPQYNAYSAQVRWRMVPGVF